MATQTILVAQQVRLKQWAKQIRDCQKRPEGMDIKTWCAQNNITKANYYYRLRRVRKVYLKQFQDQAPDFVELPLCIKMDPHLQLLFSIQKSHKGKHQLSNFKITKGFLQRYFPMFPQKCSGIL